MRFIGFKQSRGLLRDCENQWTSHGLYPVQVKICESIQVQDAALVVFIKNTRTSIVKLRQGSGKDWQGMAVKAKGVKA